MLKEHDKLAFQRNQKLRDQILELENTKSTGSPSWRRKKAELEKKEMQMLARLGLTKEQVKEYKEKEERRRIPPQVPQTTRDNRPRGLTENDKVMAEMNNINYCHHAR